MEQLTVSLLLGLTSFHTHTELYIHLLADGVACVPTSTAPPLYGECFTVKWFWSSVICSTVDTVGALL